jgi:tetratricopeptide (TPR) repeat protein
MTEPLLRTPVPNAPASWSVAAEISADALDPPERFPRWVVGASVLLLGALCAGVGARCSAPTPVVAIVEPAVAVVVDVPTPVPQVPVVAVAPIVVENINEDDINLKELPARRKARSFANRGRARLEVGNDEQARSLLERAAALDPTLPEAWRDLAVARLRLSDNAGARLASEKYARLAPGPDAQALLRLVE